MVYKSLEKVTEVLFLFAFIFYYAIFHPYTLHLDLTIVEVFLNKVREIPFIVGIKELIYL